MYKKYNLQAYKFEFCNKNYIATIVFYLKIKKKKKTIIALKGSILLK